MASTYLTRTPGSAGNRRTFTISAWVKKTLTQNASIFSAWYADSTVGHFVFRIDSGDRLGWSQWSNDSYSTRLFRDPSAWYHVVLAVDTTQGTASNRIKLYVNGIQETSFAVGPVYPSLDEELPVNNNNSQTVGSNNYSSNQNFFDGSMANVEMVDGLQLTPAYFGSTDSTTGIWTPQASSTISSYGTNGFKLKMDTATPGADTSGNTNNFTVGGGTPTLTQGSPSNNWCTWNPLIPGTTNYVYSNGNNTVNQTSGAWVKTVSTIGVNSGKWYWEVSATNAQISAGKYTVIGVATTTDATAASGMSPNGIGMKNNGSVGISTVLVATLSGFELGDIISCYLDMDNGALYYAKNGVMENSGVPTSGASKTGAFSLPNPTETHFAYMSPYGTNNKAEANFGEGFFGTTAAGTQADDNGQGLFAYDVPAGYYALNTKNLEAYG
jgi:hypothetical protein